MSPIPPISSQDDVVLYHIPKEDSRESDIFKHLHITQPSLCVSDRLCQLIVLSSNSNYDVFFHRFLERHVVQKANLYIADPAIRPCCGSSQMTHTDTHFKNISKPTFVYALHVVNMKNVKKIIVRHLTEGILYTKEITNDDLHSDISIPLAVDGEPSSIFVAKNCEREYYSAIPTYYAWDATADLEIELEPYDEHHPATCSVQYSCAYLASQHMIFWGYPKNKHKKQYVYYINGIPVSINIPILVENKNNKSSWWKRWLGFL